MNLHFDNVIEGNFNAEVRFTPTLYNSLWYYLKQSLLLCDLPGFCDGTIIITATTLWHLCSTVFLSRICQLICCMQGFI